MRIDMNKDELRVAEILQSIRYTLQDTYYTHRDGLRDSDRQQVADILRRILAAHFCITGG
jgi:hypothetical protein